MLYSTVPVQCLVVIIVSFEHLNTVGGHRTSPCRLRMINFLADSSEPFSNEHQVRLDGASQNQEWLQKYDASVILI